MIGPVPSVYPFPSFLSLFYVIWRRIFLALYRYNINGQDSVGSYLQSYNLHVRSGLLPKQYGTCRQVVSRSFNIVIAACELI